MKYCNKKLKTLPISVQGFFQKFLVDASVGILFAIGLTVLWRIKYKFLSWRRFKKSNFCGNMSSIKMQISCCKKVFERLRLDYTWEIPYKEIIHFCKRWSQVLFVKQVFWQAGNRIWMHAENLCTWIGLFYGFWLVISKLF